MTDRHPALTILDSACHSRTDLENRMRTLMDLYLLPDVLPRAVWFAYLGRTWAVGGLALSGCFNRYVEILANATPADFNAMMTPQERAALKAMPGPIPVFRGCSQFTQRGLSWSTRPGVAARFASMATRFVDKGLEPLLLTGYVSKGQAAYKDNGLSEIVSANVSVVKTERYVGAPWTPPV